MTRLAERLVIVRILEPRIIRTTDGLDVIDFLGGPDLVGVAAVGIKADRMHPDETIPVTLPAATVAALGSGGAPRVVQLSSGSLGGTGCGLEFLVSGTVLLAPLPHQTGTPQFLARAGGCIRHGVLLFGTDYFQNHEGRFFFP
jgi:hypothetical protein